MTDFSKGKWIEWTGSDEEGTFAHVGEVVKSKSTVTFAVPHGGEMTVSKSDGSFKNVRKRKARLVRPPVHLAAPVTRPLSERMKQVVALFAEDGMTISRQDAIARIVSEMGMSAAGASTYWNTARKHV